MIGEGILVTNDGTIIIRRSYSIQLNELYDPSSVHDGTLLQTSQHPIFVISYLISMISVNRITGPFSHHRLSVLEEKTGTLPQILKPGYDSLLQTDRNLATDHIFQTQIHSMHRN